MTNENEYSSIKEACVKMVKLMSSMPCERFNSTTHTCLDEDLKDYELCFPCAAKFVLEEQGYDVEDQQKW